MPALLIPHPSELSVHPLIECIELFDKKKGVWPCLNELHVKVCQKDVCFLVILLYVVYVIILHVFL